MNAVIAEHFASVMKSFTLLKDQIQQEGTLGFGKSRAVLGGKENRTVSSRYTPSSDRGVQKSSVVRLARTPQTWGCC